MVECEDCGKDVETRVDCFQRSDIPFNGRFCISCVKSRLKEYEDNGN